MYAKLFSSLYQGTLRGCADEILVFTNLLAHADSTGLVDKHWRAISEETGISQERVKAAIANLEAPDPDSRSPEMEGRRIIPIDEHRAWGWQIVNHNKYRAIRSEEDRREQNRLAQERWRNKHKLSVSNRKQSKPKQKQQAEEEAKAKKKDASTEASPRASRRVLPQNEWLPALKNNPTYSHVNFDFELGKADVWITNHPGRQLTRDFFINWINKIPVPIVINGNGKAKGCETCLNNEYVERMSLRPGELYDTATNKIIPCKCTQH